MGCDASLNLLLTSAFLAGHSFRATAGALSPDFKRSRFLFPEFFATSSDFFLK